MTDEEQDVPPGVDPTVPSVARMYDYYLGGKDNFAADREAAEKIIQIGMQTGGNIREMARANRGFLRRAVRHMAEAGVRQFLDIGTGLPTQDNVHQVVARVTPDARVVYVDNDPIVLVHARALLADTPDTIVIDGDVADPRGILEHPQVRAHLDFGKPVAILLAAILHFFHDDDQVAEIVSTFRSALVPGGYLLISHGYVEHELADPEKMEETREVYRGTSRGAIAWRDAEQVAGYFEGLRLLDPGVVPVQDWRNDDPYVPDGLSKGGVLGAVGRR
ncbi:SAM-dependent methyltransferase [Thermocatellispora tengchongensis]|uniref:SAM-dependent methyltransferase n=1 Tax=Thermocatellispora tengchongensis TaxID=1073253 RepID=A0A840NPZ4_9ACTN|nr:SAM-dependent methyltransferase [Thermocatellispora tengchongensis]MBB5130624.1 SAM-dependent methyltransferase [Thermocatellispora tengchongensis]